MEHIKNFLYFIYLVLIVIGLYVFVNAVQVPIRSESIPDIVDDKLPNVKRYDATIAVIDRNGVEYYFRMGENGEPIFDEVDKDYTNPVYRDYLSYKYR